MYLSMTFAVTILLMLAITVVLCVYWIIKAVVSLWTGA